MGDILLVRHGQASFGAADYDNLSPMGRQQSAWLGAHLSEMDYAPSLVISGGMKRHDQTLAEMAKTLKVGVTSTDAAYEEIDMWRILRETAEIIPDMPDASTDRGKLSAALRMGLTTWHEGRVTGAESWADYRQRIDEGLARAVAHDGDVMIVTSGGAIAAAVASTMGLTSGAQISTFLKLYNASVTRLVKTKNGLELHSLNTVAHLERPDRKGSMTYV